MKQKGGLHDDFDYTSICQEFHTYLGQFENMFAFNFIEIEEFEKRVKKLVYGDEYVTIEQLKECLKTAKGFEDIINEDSLTYSVLSSSYLKRDRYRTATSLRHLNDPDIQNGANDPREVYIPYVLLLGIMYAKATSRVRATKFYELVQDELTPRVSCNDKELKLLFRKLLELSSLFVMQQFRVCYLNYSVEGDNEEENFAVDPLYNLTQEGLDHIVEDMFEDFLNDLFASFTSFDKQKFIDMMSLDCAHYFSGAVLRKKIITKIVNSHKQHE